MKLILALALLCAQAPAQVIIGGFTGSGGSSGGGDAAETGTNLGSGTFYFFKQKSGTVFQFHTFDVTAPITAALAADKITLSCPTCVVTSGSYSAPAWLTGLQPTSEKNAASGYAGLTAGTKLTKTQGDEVWSLVDLGDVASKRGDGTQVQMTKGSVATDDCAKFDADGNIVSAGAACGSGSGSANEGQSFTTQTSVAITHASSTKPVVECWSADASPVRVEPHKVTRNSATQLTVEFLAAQSGNCVVNTSGGGTGTGGSYTAGIGVDATALGDDEIAVDTDTVAPKPLTFTHSEDFGSVNSGACATPVTISSLTGIQAGDSLVVSSNPALAAGVFAVVKAQATNGEVTLTVCNMSGSSNNPDSATFRITKVVTSW